MQAIWLVFAILVFLLLLCLWRAWRAGKEGVSTEGRFVAPVQPPPFDPVRAVDSLAMAVKIPTVSHADPSLTDWAAFDGYAQLLRERYPLIHQTAEVETVQERALIYRLPGRNPRAAAALWMSHQDVVPADSPEEWTHPPFAAVIEDGVLWGRGALDMKSHTIAMFEACEAVLASGHQLERDLYFALGYDEEVGVNTSAVAMAAHMKKKGVALEYVLDESTNAFFDAALFDAPGLLACIGVTEKGFGNLSIHARGEGGHASLPPRRTALMELVGALEGMDGVVLPAQIAPPISQMIEALLPRMPFKYRLLYANAFFTRPLLLRRLSKRPQCNAWIRSTVALTTAEGSPQANVLPRRASATFNIRTAPWDSAENIEKRIRRRCLRGRDVGNFTVDSDLMNAAPISSLDSPGKHLLFDTVGECFPDCIPVPSMMIGGTDATHFCAICDSVYRFSPFRSYMKYGQHIHNTDERIDVEDFLHAVEFFQRLLLRGEAQA